MKIENDRLFKVPQKKREMYGMKEMNNPTMALWDLPMNANTKRHLIVVCFNQNSSNSSLRDKTWKQQSYFYKNQKLKKRRV